jgi:hypothetical protein
MSDNQDHRLDPIALTLLSPFVFYLVPLLYALSFGIIGFLIHSFLGLNNSNYDLVFLFIIPGYIYWYLLGKFAKNKLQEAEKSLLSPWLTVLILCGIYITIILIISLFLDRVFPDIRSTLVLYTFGPLEAWIFGGFLLLKYQFPERMKTVTEIIYPQLE